MTNSKTKITKNPEKRELIIERVIRAPLALVWDSWTKPEHIAKWWGPKGWSTTVLRMDVQPSGVWHYCMQPEEGGLEAWGRATYHEVDDLSRLIFTDASSDGDGRVTKGTEMLTTVEFIPQGKAQTKLIIRTQFATADKLESADGMGMVEGFIETLNRLEDLLGKSSG